MRSILTSLCGLLLLAANISKANCNLEIEGNDAMQFNTKELSVPASCTEVKLTLKHVGKLPKTAMGHNWILVKEKDLQTVSSQGLTAGPTHDYIPQDKSLVIASTKLLGGGEQDTITFSTKALSPSEKYLFFCSFPGHFALMKGSFSIK